MLNGEVLNQRYEVQQQLGKKSGRRTLLARDSVAGDLVIIKLLSFGSDFEWDDLKLFEREAQTLKSLSHPSIPRYLDYFEVKSSNFQGFALIQTYIPAKTLEEYLQTGRTFTESEVKEIGKAVLEILVYLHELHPPVIHRDIKPSNILLGERTGNSVGKVYLVDFGSVQTVLAAETGTRTIVGTYGYMPQEQFGGRTVPASDLYSLGATLIYVVTGTQPADLPQKDFRIQFEQLANLSPNLTNWLKRMIEPDLEKRFASATEALTVLDKSQVSTNAALTFKQPANSKIQLTKYQDILEITIPPRSFQFSLVWGFLIAVAWNSFTVSVTVILFVMPSPFFVKISAFLFLLPFLSIGFYMIYWALLGLFYSVKIRIDNKQITLHYQLGQWKIKSRFSSARESINKLIFTRERFIKHSDGEKTHVPPNLVLWAGAEKLEFGIYQYNKYSFQIKSEAELEWLANELSDWLGIEITS